jgi:hypothetical protein
MPLGEFTPTYPCYIPKGRDGNGWTVFRFGDGPTFMLTVLTDEDLRDRFEREHQPDAWIVAHSPEELKAILIDLPTSIVFVAFDPAPPTIKHIFLVRDVLEYLERLTRGAG